MQQTLQNHAIILNSSNTYEIMKNQPKQAQDYVHIQNVSD